MSICKRITRSLGTLIFLWITAACAAQSLEVTDVSGASDAGAGSNEVAAVSITETGPVSQEVAPDPDAETAGASQPGAAASDVTSGPAGGRAEGITVHGHWTIEIRDPDGTVVNYLEFENALNPAGAVGLARVLRRELTFGRWRILLDNSVGAKPCNFTTGQAGCLIVESSDPGTTPDLFKNLTITGPNPTQVRLSGSAIAANTATITAIATVQFYCVGTASPTTCAGATLTPPLDSSADSFFTVSSSPADFAAVDVLAGQQVQVTVVLSFS